MKKRILAILLAIALLSSVAAVVAYAAGEYSCPQCATKFDTESARDLHMSENKSELTCSQCDWKYVLCM